MSEQQKKKTILGQNSVSKHLLPENPRLLRTRETVLAAIADLQNDTEETALSIMERRRVRFKKMGNYKTQLAHDTAERQRRIEERRHRRREQRRALIEIRRKLKEERSSSPRILVDELDMKEATLNYSGSLHTYLAGFLQYPPGVGIFELELKGSFQHKKDE